MKMELCNDSFIWNKLLDTKVPSTIFHRFEWGKVMEVLPDVTFHPYIVRHDKGTFLLPMYSQRGVWSWSMLGYGGPCVDENMKLSFEDLNLQMKEITGERVSRVALPFNVNLFYDEKEDVDWKLRDTHLLEVPKSYEELWNSCSGKVRTSVRLARKYNVRIRRLDAENMLNFYRMYSFFLKV